MQDQATRPATEEAIVYSNGGHYKNTAIAATESKNIVTWWHVLILLGDGQTSCLNSSDQTTFSLENRSVDHLPQCKSRGAFIFYVA